jgi:hypothetical protein
MRPPVLAQALVAAIAPQNDYESVAGDLHEEYLRYARVHSTRAANWWYWSQVLLSIPSLLSYSRAHRSALRALGIGIAVPIVLAAMLLASLPIDLLLMSIYGSMDGCPMAVQFTAYWTEAVAFGALLALIVRKDGVRVAFCASMLLVLCYGVPALLGFPSSQAPLLAWVLLAGAVPAMCAGAALYQAAARLRMRRPK